MKFLVEYPNETTGTLEAESEEALINEHFGSAFEAFREGGGRIVSLPDAAVEAEEQPVENPAGQTGEEFGNLD
jgi:hypothetical protein